MKWPLNQGCPAMALFITSQSHVPQHICRYARQKVSTVSKFSIFEFFHTVPLLIVSNKANSLFNGLLYRTTWVSRHKQVKPLWILKKQEMMGWQWYQLDHMQIICTSLQTDNHASTSSLIFTGWVLFLMPNQQCQSTDGKNIMMIQNNGHDSVTRQYKPLHIIPECDRQTDKRSNTLKNHAVKTRAKGKAKTSNVKRMLSSSLW